MKIKGSSFWVYDDNDEIVKFAGFPIRIDKTDYVGNSWAIRNFTGDCLGSKDCLWHHESLPSYRDKRWFEDFRFVSIGEATEFLEKALLTNDFEYDKEQK